MTFGERLRQLRLEKNLTMEDVATVIGTSRATIHKYETGKIMSAPPEKVHKLANYFGVTRPYLMGWTEERKANPSVNLETVAMMQHARASANWRTNSLSGSDCMTAATQAARALIKFHVARTPIYPHQIVQQSRIATMVSFADMAELDRIADGSGLQVLTRNEMMMSSVKVQDNGQPEYLFAMNRNAPIGKTRLAMAVELGHIYLGHGLERDEPSRVQEAECFAIHMEFPRAMVQILLERGVIFTKENFSRIFGDCEWCLDSVLNAAPVTISPELNQMLREQFVPYADALQEMGVLSLPIGAHDQVLDLSKYMAGYEE